MNILQANQKKAKIALEEFTKRGLKVFHNPNMDLATVEKSHNTIQRYEKKELDKIYIYQLDNDLTFEEAIASFYIYPPIR